MADYERVLQGKYPAKQHARRVVNQIRAKLPDASGVIYLEGRMTKLIEDNDEPVPFRWVPTTEGPTTMAGIPLTMTLHQTATLLLLPYRSRSSRLPPDLRHPDLEIDPLHTSDRSRQRHLVGPAPDS
jgi:hypothetical protein